MKLFSSLYTLVVTAAIVCTATLSSCIEDGFTNNPNDQPTFSVDTLKMGLAFSEEGTPTHKFKVYNRHGKGLMISRIAFRDGGTGAFRLNVDGVPGEVFNDVEIRANDSIFVLVEATPPSNGGKSTPVAFYDKVDFTVNGVQSTVVLEADVIDAEVHKGWDIKLSRKLKAHTAYQIYDSLVVRPDVTLTIPEGVTLYFHDKAWMRVDGTLVVNGTAQAPVNFVGDRFGYVAADIPYEIMSGQWSGILFSCLSKSNKISHASVRNTINGILLDSLFLSPVPALKMVNCQVRNSTGYALQALHSSVEAYGCEFADAAFGVVGIAGEHHVFNQCTFANQYLFAYPDGEIIQLYRLDPDDQYGAINPTTADFSNCVVWGNGGDIYPGVYDGYNVFFRYCSFSVKGSDDANFISCLWETDPLFRTDTEKYIFDYRLREESPVIGKAAKALVNPETAIDFYGVARGSEPDLGAYQH